MSKCYLLFAEGLEECEGLITLDILRRAGLETYTVSVQDAHTVVGAHGVPITCDRTLPELLAAPPELVVLPGGMPGTTNLAKSPAVEALVRRTLEHGGRVAAICAAPNAKPADVKLVQKILGGAGETVVLKEKDFDAVTALSGSGPAYFAYMEEAMTEGGIKLGLKPEVARLLAEQTMYGTAKFLRESGMALRPFIEGVCTKGGTTAAGMVKMDVPAFKQIVADTLAAAAARSAELA